jgi:predicted DsbA family dithiol-disulfide isomerase
LGLNQAKFTTALDSRLYQPVLDEDAAEARRQGVYGVPVFFVNGKRMDGVQPLTAFKDVIDTELAKTQTITNKPLTTENTKDMEGSKSRTTSKISRRFSQMNAD